MREMAIANSLGVHGTIIDQGSNTIQCKYCGKTVKGFSRLAHHLGGVGNDVSPCDKVQEAVRVPLWNDLFERKQEKLRKQIGELCYPELPERRKARSISINSSQGSSLKGQADQQTSAKNVTEDTGFSAHPPPRLFSCRMGDKPQQSKLEVAAQSVNKFLSEAGIDPSITKLPSFANMVDALIVCGAGIKAPTDGPAPRRPDFRDEFCAVVRRAEELKRSWQQTGCSILLEFSEHNDAGGKCVVTVMVHCAQGALFLKSADASHAVSDVDELAAMICGIVEEVGPENAVQIISNNASPYMQAAEQRVMSKYKHLFCSLCSHFCIDLMLERIAAFEASEVLSQMKDLTAFKPQCSSHHLASSSNLRYVDQFTALKDLVLKKDSLMDMFGGPLVKNISFWAAATDILKIVDPLLDVLKELKARNCSVGFVYNALDSAKSAIRHNVGGSRYKPYWDLIDEVWNNYLHSPIHAAGCFLNPGLFYLDGIRTDREVNTGLLECVVCMVKDADQRQVVSQLRVYEASLEGVIDSDIAIQQASTLPPEQWWSTHGCRVPELQRLATRILSQTCSGVSEYKLDKEVTRQVHSVTRSINEQLSWRDLEYVHHNRQLIFSTQ